MMTRTFPFFLACVFLAAACDNNTPDAESLPAGQVTLVKSNADGLGPGFSFEPARVITLPSSEGIMPDLLLGIQRNEANQVSGIFFSSEDEIGSFQLLGTFHAASSAEAFFDTLFEVPSSGYQTVALDVRANQVWAIRTREGTFAKIRILSATAQDSTGVTEAQTIFDWVYQPNGSPLFSA